MHQHIGNFFCGIVALWRKVESAMPIRVQFVEELCDLVTALQSIPDLWQLAQAYFSNNLVEHLGVNAETLRRHEDKFNVCNNGCSDGSCLCLIHCIVLSVGDAAVSPWVFRWPSTTCLLSCLFGWHVRRSTCKAGCMDIIWWDKAGGSWSLASILCQARQVCLSVQFIPSWWWRDIAVQVMFQFPVSTPASSGGAEIVEAVCCRLEIALHD